MSAALCSSRALLRREASASAGSASRFCKTQCQHNDENSGMRRSHVQWGRLHKSRLESTRLRQATPFSHHVCRGLPDGKRLPDISELKQELKNKVEKVADKVEKVADKVVDKLSEPAKYGFMNDVQRLSDILQMANDSFNEFALVNPENNRRELSLEQTLRLLNSEAYQEQLTYLVGSSEGPSWTEEDVRRWFKTFDRGDRGALRRSEFLLLWLNSLRGFFGTADTKTLTLAFFRYLDQDGDGKVDTH
eukprot:260437-Prorocentrum_minimum.AAC.3